MTRVSSVLGNSAHAGRAVGAMFFAVFGGAWMALWARSEYPGATSALLAIGLVVAALLGASYRTYKANALALRATANTPERIRRSRMFNLVNAGQWCVIVLVAGVLSALGHSQWIVPAIIVIVGLHFFPLARLFRYQPHCLTGAALVLLGSLYPFVASAGPRSAVGALGAGIILWLSAIWAVLPFCLGQE